MDNIILQETRFQTSDGVVLTGHFFVPRHAPRAVVVLAGATGVPERFYRHFARWLAAENSLACLTFTYRDMHRTTPRAMRAARARMQDWAITDGQAARDAARAAFPDMPVWQIGHSLGGMMVSKQPRLAGVVRLITVGSGLVDHRQHPMPYRLLVWLFWFVIGPFATRTLGYLPGRLIGLGANLPARVFWQWRRWCTAGPDGFLADTRLPPSDWSKSGAPVRIVAFADDEICPPECAFALAKAYRGALVGTVLIDPKTKDLTRLGHLGVFRPEARALWPDLIARAQPETKHVGSERLTTTQAGLVTAASFRT